MIRPAAFLLVALILGARVSALDPARAITQARLSVWTSEAGLPQNTAGALAQTRDGYLWIGTEEGLARFDGMRFVVTDPRSAPALRAAFISSVFQSRDGTLWIGTYGGGLARMRDGRIEAFRPDVLGADRIREMHETAGGLFVATAGGGVLRIDGNDVTRVTTRDGLPADRIWAIEDDGEGGMWVATHGGGVVRLRGSRVLQHLSTREGLPNDFARALLRDPDGTLWIGTDGGGLAMWRNGAVVRVLTARDGLPSAFVRSLLRDRDGSLWIGTDGGLARMRGAAVESIGVPAGLPAAGVLSMIEDREGSIWVGTTGGLVRLRDTRVLPITRKQGLPVDTIRAIHEDRAGTVWLGTEGGGLCTSWPGSTRCISLPHDAVYALADSADGSLWAGTDGGGVVRLRDRVPVETIDVGAGLPNNRVRALVETPNGDLWVSTTTGLARVNDGGVHVIREFDNLQLRPLLALRDGTLLVGTDGAGLWRVRSDGTGARVVAKVGRGLENDRVFSLAPDARANAVWIGTSGGGLARLEVGTGSVKSVTRRAGLYDDVVFQVLDDGTDLWLTSNRGLYRVRRDRVLAAMNGERADLSGTVYGTSDGMPSSECVGASPGAMRARNGRIWVATARGAAVIDPVAGIGNRVPPPVYVEEVLLDGVRAADGPLRVPPDTQRLDVRYTALSLRAPERVTFRYRLEGYDRDWIDGGTSRVAHYTKLAPGSYTFRVTAKNEDGVRSTNEGRLELTVEPRWFETWWARLIGLALIAAAIWGAVQLRFVALRARKNAELAHMAAELEAANARLRDLSYLDGLTGVANRRRFDEALQDAIADEGRQPVSLVLIDLDHFKRLNDMHGHHTGDDALRRVAALLAERTTSRGGLVARVGGEEFAWLLPGVPLDAATSEAEAFRLAVRDAAIPHRGSDFGIVTTSLGVSSTRGANAVTPEALVAAADAALYRAKSAGRDRVEAEALASS